MRVVYIFLFCCFVGACLGALSASVMNVPLAPYFGAVFGGCVGALLSLIALWKRDNKHVFTILVISFILSFPVAMVAGKTDNPLIAIVLTSGCAISTFLILMHRNANSNDFVNVKAVYLVALFCLAVGGIYVYKKRTPQDPRTLIELMGSNDMETSLEAANKLRAYGKKEPFLIALRHNDNKVRAVAAHFLGLLGDKSVQPNLIEAARDHDPHVRMWAAFSLGRIGDAEALPILSSLKEDDVEIVRIQAQRAIDGLRGRIGQ